MTCTVMHTIGPNGGHTLPKGTRPNKPCRWAVSVWLVLPDNSKDTHSFAIGPVEMFDLVPLVNERVSELIAENGADVLSAGWTAHGRGEPKKRRKKK